MKRTLIQVGSNDENYFLTFAISDQVKMLNEDKLRAIQRAMGKLMSRIQLIIKNK